MRVAIVGTGTQAGQHLRAFSQIDGVDIAGVASRTAPSPSRISELGSPHVYANVGEVLKDPAVTAVVIATPTSAHRDLTLAALRAGKHVLCECPIAHTLKEASEMIAAAREADRLLQVGLIHRFEAPWRRMVDLIKSKQLGPALAMASQRLSAFTADGLAKPHHGDAFHELLTFDILFFQWAFGEVVEISAQSDRHDGAAREVTALLRSQEVRATCFVSDRMPRGYPFTESTKVLFEKGAAELTMRFWPDRIETDFRIEPLGGTPERIEVRGDNPFIAQARYFASAIERKVDRSYAGAETAMELLQVTIAAAEAAAAGKTIRLKPIMN